MLGVGRGHSCSWVLCKTVPSCMSGEPGPKTLLRHVKVLAGKGMLCQRHVPQPLQGSPLCCASTCLDRIASLSRSLLSKSANTCQHIFSHQWIACTH